MSDHSYEDTGVWQAAFEGDLHKSAKQKLRAAYSSFWDNTVVLAEQISKDLPDLTLHNEAHFLALWRSVDLIVGQSCNLNPLEVFILGGAILLHDLGHAVATFPKGLAEVQKTPQWADAMSIECGTALNKVTNPDICLNVKRRVLFYTLRTLHGSRAQHLAEIKFTRPDTHDCVPLIEDTTLRTHAGEIMGLIAASHHWDINRVASDLPEVIGPPSVLPSSWSVNPIKLACLIRCADAIQIDQSRAPDFLFSLLQLQGLSESHWRAQNRLTSPIIDTSDRNSIVFSSSRTFRASDAEAWWIAFDAIQVANKELGNADRLMRDLRISSFGITGIKDAQSEERLSRHVKTEGWRPVRAKPFVAAAERIISMFGGAQLYGNDNSVALRELIQNAADAIRARRADANDPRFKGRIDVTLVESEKGKYFLSIDDDGIGMTEKVLTGPLLEFGKSYWNSDLLRGERPGLVSKLNNQIGRYGIGFYSVFMLSRKVQVCSRSYRGSVSEFRTLSFADGYKARPILLDQALEDMPISASTRVVLSINDADIERLQTLYLRPRVSGKAIVATLQQLVAHLCPSLDVDIFVTVDGKTQCAHAGEWMVGDKLQWLRDITCADLQENEELDRVLERAAPLLRPIVTEMGDVIGFATLNDTTLSTGVSTVGGLVDAHCCKAPDQFSITWVGVLDRTSSGPRRNGSEFAASSQQLADWADASGAELTKTAPSPGQRYLAAHYKAEFNANPKELANILVNGELTDIDVIAEDLCDNKAQYVIPIDIRSSSDDVKIGQLSFRVRDGYYLGLGRSEVEYAGKIVESSTIFGLSNTRYHILSLEKKPVKNSFFECLREIIANRGFELKNKIEEDLIQGRYIGKSSAREGLEAGADLKGLTLLIWAESPPPGA